MLNFTFEPSTVLGLQFGISMLLLYLLRFVHPILALDEDVLFATLGLVYSCIIIIHGWRLDPILLFSQVLIVIVCTATGFTSLRLRAITFMITNQIGLEIDDYTKNFLFWTKIINKTKIKNK